MGSRKVRKLNYFKLFSVLLVFIFIVLLVIFIVRKVFSLNTEKDIFMINMTNQDVSLFKDWIRENEIDIEYEYKYNNTYLKDYVISQSISENSIVNKGDKVKLIISLGEMDKSKLAHDKINELGSVPIMMYHGIKNIPSSETGNTGGNVDKDGYTRTAEAFRSDLETYYQKGYRMIKLSDYINGNIDVEYGYSPIILTFDDGNDNNIKVTGLDNKGNIIIDKNSAVGILEDYKKKYPDYNVTAIFFVTNALFNQPEYNEKILKWLVENGYEVGNHTMGHNNFSNINTSKTEEVVGGVYQKLESIIGDKYSHIVALPFGSPYNKSHSNYSHILKGSYNGVEYETVGALRVGWEPEVSPFNKNFDATFLKRCRAYDNNGREFDIEMTLKLLENRRYISDGMVDTIVTSKKNEGLIKSDILDKEVILYEEE